MMTCSSRVRHALVAPSVRLAVAGALIYAGVVAAPAMAAVGYPTPGGIYAPFTNCPLRNPVMRGSVGGSATGCIASINTSGTFTINGIPTPVTHPVIVQFGVWSPPNATPSQFSGGVVQPANGQSLVTSPEEIPGGLPLLLLCPGSTPGVAKLCKKAMTSGHTEVTAQVLSAGPIDNFQLTTFTQPVKIQLNNPLLGGKCFIGSDSDPIVLNPNIISGNLQIFFDPDPVRFPNTAVLAILDAVATDDTFSVPAATGCGPGGVANDAINSLLGLPSPSGNNHLVLNGDSLFADDFSQSNQARELLAAFKASVGVPPELPPASPSGAFLD